MPKIFHPCKLLSTPNVAFINYNGSLITLITPIGVNKNLYLQLIISIKAIEYYKCILSLYCRKPDGVNFFAIS